MYTVYTHILYRVCVQDGGRVVRKYFIVFATHGVAATGRKSSRDRTRENSYFRRDLGGARAVRVHYTSGFVCVCVCDNILNTFEIAQRLCIHAHTYYTHT